MPCVDVAFVGFHLATTLFDQFHTVISWRRMRMDLPLMQYVDVVSGYCLLH